MPFVATTWISDLAFPPHANQISPNGCPSFKQPMIFRKGVPNYQLDDWTLPQLLSCRAYRESSLRIVLSRITGTKKGYLITSQLVKADQEYGESAPLTCY